MKNASLFALVAIFLTIFSSEIKAQMPIACTHDFRDFVASGGDCDQYCECTFQFQLPVNLNPSLYNMEVRINGVLTSYASPLTILSTDTICFLIKHPNGDTENCCFGVTDFCDQ